MDSFDFKAINTLFSQQVSIKEDAEEYLEELEILVDEIRETLVKDRDFRKLETFVKTLETHQPEIMDREGKYFYHDFVEHFCAAGDFEKAEIYFEPFIKRPVNDFDMYLSAFKKLLFYQRNTILQRAIQQNYEEVRDSDQLFGNAVGLLDHNIYLIATQEVYEKSDQNFDIKLLEEKLKPFNFDFSEDPIETYNLGFYADTPDDQYLMNSFRKDQDALLMLLRNIFMKRMLSKGLQFTISGFLFDNSRNYWDMKSPNKKKGNWKSYFKITSKTFDDFLIGLKGSFLGENYDEMIALAWGVAYVYDFLLEAEIIDTVHYAEFQAVYKKRIAGIMGSSLASLNVNAYVMHWPKPEVVTVKEWEAQQSIFKKSITYQNDRSLDVKALMEDDFDAFGVYKMDIVAAYEESVERKREMQDLMLAMEDLDDEFDEGFYDEFEANYNKEFEDEPEEDFIEDETPEAKDFKFISTSTPHTADAKPGRNEPCPCGSGKKYKKCCGRNA